MVIQFITTYEFVGIVHSNLKGKKINISHQDNKDFMEFVKFDQGTAILKLVNKL